MTRYKATATVGVCLALSRQSLCSLPQQPAQQVETWHFVEHRPCLKLPTHISKEQRAHWHRLAEHKGLTSQSQVWKLDYDQLHSYHCLHDTDITCTKT